MPSFPLQDFGSPLSPKQNGPPFAHTLVMTDPRDVIPGRTYLFTRRTAQRQFLLLPSEVVEQVFLYCLAFAAAAFGLQVHAFCVLSNHYHLVATDPLGRHPFFMHWFHLHVAKLLNIEHKRGESLWSSEKYSAVHLVNREAVLDKIAYTISNPVSSWLVSRSDRWPGLLSLPKALAGHLHRVIRPSFFFRDTGPCPQQVDLKMTKPPGLEDLTDDEFRALVCERVQSREDALRRQRRCEGKGFFGRRRLKAQKIHDTPYTAVSGAAARRRITPRVACKDKWRRIERLGRLVSFRQAYAVAMAAWRGGDHSVVFPAGTFLMCLLYGVSCAPP
jgi:putative transposase